MRGGAIDGVAALGVVPVVAPVATGGLATVTVLLAVSALDGFELASGSGRPVSPPQETTNTTTTCPQRPPCVDMVLEYRRGRRTSRANWIALASSPTLPNESQPPLREGELLAGRYRIAGLLGEGGHGRVYRAVQLPLEREVAIKIVDARDAARFVREAAIVRSLEHPNTVRVMDLGTTPEGDPFLVLELLRGHDVDQLLERQGCLSAEDALDITAQVLKSLAEAHEKGIVHRDIKPGNVFVTSHFGEPLFVKVLDFGIAKELRSEGKLTAVGEMLGTPAYMPPEQALGTVVDARADIYAVGLMLAEMYTGKLVFSKGGPLTIIDSQAGAEPVPLDSEITASVIGPIVTRAVKKDPSQRYASAAEMLRDVEATRRSLTRAPHATPAPAALYVTAPQGTAAQLMAAQPTVLQPTRPPPSLPHQAAGLHTMPQQTLSQQAVAPPTVPQLTVPQPTREQPSSPLRSSVQPFALPFTSPSPPPTFATPLAPRHAGTAVGRRLVLVMGAIIAVLAALLVIVLVGRGGEPRARAPIDEDESEPETTQRRTVRSVTSSVKAPRLRTVPQLKQAFREAGYSLSSIQEGPEDALVYSFMVERSSCSGSIVRMVAASEGVLEGQARHIGGTPGCRVRAEGNVLIYACFASPGTPSSDSCVDAAAKLLTN